MNFQDELPRLLDELADDHVVALPVIAQVDIAAAPRPATGDASRAPPGRCGRCRAHGRALS